MAHDGHQALAGCVATTQGRCAASAQRVAPIFGLYVRTSGDRARPCFPRKHRRRIPSQPSAVPVNSLSRLTRAVLSSGWAAASRAGASADGRDAGGCHSVLHQPRRTDAGGRRQLDPQPEPASGVFVPCGVRDLGARSGRGARRRALPRSRPNARSSCRSGATGSARVTIDEPIAVNGGKVHAAKMRSLKR